MHTVGKDELGRNLGHVGNCTPWLVVAVVGGRGLKWSLEVSSSKVKPNRYNVPCKFMGTGSCTSRGPIMKQKIILS